MRARALPVGDNNVKRTCYPDAVVTLVLLDVTQCTMSSLYLSIVNTPMQYTAIFHAVKMNIVI